MIPRQVVVLLLLFIPSKHFWLLQTFDRKHLAKVKSKGIKTIYNRIFFKT